MADLRILIADDHDLIRRGIRQLLSVHKGWEIVHEASNGQDAVEFAASQKPDIAILDFSMPLMDGPTAAAKIIESSSDTRVIILTMHDSEQAIHDVLRAGALGLVLKSEADHVLLAAVEAVAAGRTYFTHRAASIVHETHRRQSSSYLKASEPRTLTDREREVIRLIADGLTNKEVAVSLRISTRTVESHRLNINRKIGFNSIADLVRYAIRNNMASYS